MDLAGLQARELTQQALGITQTNTAEKSGYGEKWF
jgi:hypothetical protein